ncbi:helix-turn-helix transcriptional regulator [Methylomonas defluvii]|uniref:helix-turn-helix transcriptional regulator n=1 Tax=Methylomonas defluvii TaxID=3045149 RepID=UPI003CC69885
MQQASTADQIGTKKRNKTTYVPKQLPEDPDALVRLPSILAVSGMSRTTFLDGIKSKKFPPGRLLSPRCRAWTVQEVREMLAKLKIGCAA